MVKGSKAWSSARPTGAGRLGGRELGGQCGRPVPVLLPSDKRRTVAPVRTGSQTRWLASCHCVHRVPGTLRKCGVGTGAWKELEAPRPGWGAHDGTTGSGLLGLSFMQSEGPWRKICGRGGASVRELGDGRVFAPRPAWSHKAQAGAGRGPAEAPLSPESTVLWPGLHLVEMPPILMEMLL